MDKNLLKFATPRQAEYLKALWSEGSQRKAAKVLGVGSGTVSNAIRSVKSKAAQGSPETEVEFDPLPDSDVELDELVGFMCRRFEKRNEAYKASRWRKVHVKTDQPFGVMWFGDPHVDDKEIEVWVRAILSNIKMKK